LRIIFALLDRRPPTAAHKWLSAPRVYSTAREPALHEAAQGDPIFSAL
jgi:hypothetical protein